MTKYSSISYNFLIAIFLTLWSIADAPAQDFGEAVYDLSDYVAVGGGISVQHFAPSAGNLLPDSSALRISNPRFHLEFRSPETRLALGYSSYSRNGKSGTAVSIEVESRQEIPLLRSGLRSGIFLPISVNTNFLNATSLSTGAKDVNVACLGAGTGLDMRWLRRDFGCEARCTGVFHYATQSFSIDDGTSNLLSAEVLVLLPDIAGRSIVAGYRYELQIWKMKRSDLNYRREISGLFLDIIL